MSDNNLLPDEILALTLYGEARGEPIQGQVAVANVIINRLRHYPSKFKTAADVCLEPKQFSCWNIDDANYPILMTLSRQMIQNKIMDQSLKQCLYIARGVIGNNILDNTKSAMHYITSSLFNSDKRPSWAANPTNPPIQIGNQVFFNV